MPRVSRKQADENHAAVIAAASRLFRANGIDGVSVPVIMAEAGLTHGAFYGHFASKDELAAAACTHAFEEKQELYDDLFNRHGADKRAALGEFVARYTGKAHRDQPGLGCPVPALADDVAREETKSPMRRTFAAGLERMVQRLKPLLGRAKGVNARDEALANIAMLVGAVVLARATKGHAMSDEVLLAVRRAIVPGKAAAQ
jgi:TetR/AcrR family transcriptional repressor of nem operon